MRHRVRSSRRCSVRARPAVGSSRTTAPTVTVLCLPSRLCFTFRAGRVPPDAVPDADQPLELTATLFIVLEHVVARACRRQEDDVAGRRHPTRRGDDVAERGGQPLDGYDAPEIVLDDRRRFAVREYDLHRATNLVGEGGVWLALVTTAEQEHRRPRHSTERDFGRGNVCRLGVVDPEHAVALANGFDPMLEPLKGS